MLSKIYFVSGCASGAAECISIAKDHGLLDSDIKVVFSSFFIFGMAICTGMTSLLMYDLYKRGMKYVKKKLKIPWNGSI